MNRLIKLEKHFQNLKEAPIEEYYSRICYLYENVFTSQDWFNKIQKR
jgi:nitrate reductase beta subunit